MYMTILGGVFLGLAFFLTSGFVFEEKVEVLSSPVNEDIKVSSTENVVINRWIYDPKTGQMEVIIDTGHLKNEYDTIDFEAFQRSDGSEVDTEVVFQYEDHYVVRLEGLSPDYTQVALDLIGTKEVPEEEEAEEEQSGRSILRTLYADYREVEEASIEERESGEYISYTTDLIIEGIRENIQTVEEDIKDLKADSKDAEERIASLREDKVYQTDEEKLQTDNDINALEVKKNETAKEIERLKMDLERFDDKIQKTEQREREQLLETTD
ncbi:hypothetical protein D479_16284 [Halobacillus sp. BAB-2008]|nr:hypothetical protein D479_16284 [Halobacillus sp. BAB-2008]